MTIRDLRPVAVEGWRVAVVTAHPATGDRPAGTVIEILPLVGWALVADPENGDWWAPCWWDDLGLTTGNPWQQIAWPLGPGEDLDPEFADHLRREAAEMVANRKATQ